MDNPTLKDWLMFFLWLGAFPLLFALGIIIIWNPLFFIALVLITFVVSECFIYPPKK